MSASARCRHSDLHFDIHHTGMSDSNVGSVRLAAKCNICGARMRLSRGLPMGASSQHPTIDPDTGGLGIMFPVIAEGEDPDKEWGFSVTRQVIA